MPRYGTVVYLNGIAASGKSTLARGLQARWPEPFLHVGLDWMTEAMPRRFLFDGPDADLGARWVTDAKAMAGLDAHLVEVRCDRAPAASAAARG